jgi:hypothetical protein
VRVCEDPPQPSYCVVESTDAYKTDRRECNCQTCRNCTVRAAGRGVLPLRLVQRLLRRPPSQVLLLGGLRAQVQLRDVLRVTATPLV